MDTFRREYRLKGWVQAWYLALGVIFSVFGIRVISAAIVDANWNSFRGWWDFLISVGFLAPGYYFFALALRSRVVLEGTRITVRYPIREKSADLSAIIGYRTTITIIRKNGPFWRLELKGGRGSIAIMQSFNVDTYFQLWLQQLPELDKGSLFL
jgi:hypothetical protein